MTTTHHSDPTAHEAIARLRKYLHHRPLDRLQLERERQRAERIGDRCTLAVIAEKLNRERYGRAA